MTITEFLTARLDEDEATARASVGEAVFQKQTGHWRAETVTTDSFGDSLIVFALTERGAKTQVADLTAAWEKDQRGAHIARHNPARVLADIAAKRAIVAEYVEAEAYYRAHADAPAGELTGLKSAVRHLASAYASHKDYGRAQ